MTHTPKAWYSAITTDGSELRCWRCNHIFRRQNLSTHTSKCWPETGRPIKAKGPTGEDRASHTQASLELP